MSAELGPGALELQHDLQRGRNLGRILLPFGDAPQECQASSVR